MVKITRGIYRQVRQAIGKKIFIAFTALLLTTWFFIIRVPISPHRSSTTFLFSSPESETITFQQWHIPKWVQRYNVSRLFDWTWHKNGDFRRCRASIFQSLQAFACRTTSAMV
ncbi:unnamed protein product, partial [Rotaria socialis]